MSVEYELGRIYEVDGEPIAELIDGYKSAGVDETNARSLPESAAGQLAVYGVKEPGEEKLVTVSAPVFNTGGRGGGHSYFGQEMHNEHKPGCASDSCNGC